MSVMLKLQSIGIGFVVDCNCVVVAVVLVVVVREVLVIGLETVVVEVVDNNVGDDVDGTVDVRGACRQS